MTNADTKWIRRILILCGTVIATGLLIYWWNNYDSISKSTKEWAEFSSFIGLFVSFSSLIATLGLAYFVYRVNYTKEVAAKELQLSLTRAYLVFILKLNEPGMYYLKNIGKGGAINIKVKYKRIGTPKEANWLETVVCYSLGQGDELPISWTDNEGELIATYQDVVSLESYCSIITENEVDVFKIDKNNATHSRYTDPKFDGTVWHFWNNDFKKRLGII